MTNTEVYTLLIQATNLYAGELGIDNVAYPGKKFTPPDSGLWWEMSISPNDIDPDISGEEVIRRGIWQINICARPDTSLLTVSAAADDFILDGPEKGVAAEGITITSVPKVSGLIELDDRLIMPITITYSE